MMERSAKEALVRTYRGLFAEAGAIVVSEYRGLRVAEMEELRRNLRAAGGAFCVIKNRVAKRALSGTPAEALADLFTGPTALAWSEDPVAAAKVTAEFAREHSALVPRGGMMGETVLDLAALKTLARLPALPQMRAQLLSLLQAPAQKLAQLLQTPAGQLARVTAQKPDAPAAEEKTESAKKLPTAAPPKESA